MVDGGHERQPDHLGLVRKHLGPMPPPERPTDLSLWVGAYVNPLPALGVALEIRPLLLRATTARQLCGNHSARRRRELDFHTGEGARRRGGGGNSVFNRPPRRVP